MLHCCQMCITLNDSYKNKSFKFWNDNCSFDLLFSIIFRNNKRYLSCLFMISFYGAKAQMNSFILFPRKITRFLQNHSLTSTHLSVFDFIHCGIDMPDPSDRSWPVELISVKYDFSLVSFYIDMIFCFKIQVPKWHQLLDEEMRTRNKL